MSRIPLLMLVVFCCAPGCAAVNSGRLTSIDDAQQDSTSPLASSRQSEPEDPPVMVSLSRGELEFNILPIGSYVSVQCDTGRKYQGTIVHRDQTRLELANCLQTTVHSDDGQAQLTTQCVPFQVVEKPTIERLTVMSLPSTKFNPPEMRFELADTEVVAVEFHSGRVQHWVEPQIEASFSRDEHSREEMVQAIHNVEAGSQIAFIDSSGKQYNALVLSSTSQQVNLRCCVGKEAIESRDGREAYGLSILPISSFDVDSISTFSVVESPSPDFESSDFDTGCELCIADVIYKSGRRQSQWKLARDDARMTKFFDQKASPVMKRNLASAG